jgi:hypothetical protein
MLAHFLIENGMKNEALYFLTNSIYVSCPNISEVARVDIYLTNDLIDYNKY